MEQISVKLVILENRTKNKLRKSNGLRQIVRKNLTPRLKNSVESRKKET